MSSRRKGLRVRFAKDVQSEVRSTCIDFIKWLRKKMTFPIRVTVYITNDYLVRTRYTRIYAPAVFWGPYNPENEPHIRVATGNFEKSIEEHGYYNTTADNFDSIAHELIHYQQWLVNPKFKYGEREANKKAELLVYEYLDCLDKFYSDRVDALANIIDAESLSELIDIFKKCDDIVGEKIVNKLRMFNKSCKAQNFLIEQTHNTNYDIRASSLMSLCYFVKNAKTNNRSLLLRLAASHYLRDICDRSNVDICIQCLESAILKEKDKEVYETMLKSLDYLNKYRRNLKL